jgi:hypothetical protein
MILAMFWAPIGPVLGSFEKAMRVADGELDGPI